VAIHGDGLRAAGQVLTTDLKIAAIGRASAFGAGPCLFALPREDRLSPLARRAVSE
jgi:hypothetical protein